LAKSLRPVVAEVVDALCEAITLVVSAVGFKVSCSADSRSWREMRCSELSPLAAAVCAETG
jgi:hypothetical protein